MKKNGPQPIRKIVLAHLDTGSNVTTVDKRLAVDLGLILVGGCTTHTAAGPIDANKYMVNITFPNTELKGFNLIVNDCVLHYDPHAETLNPEFFAMVIGRDIMEHWNIVWNGPSSTVIISD
ncbi:MAG: retropepsin-like domain-containing protein [Clostridia bacterium]|nr:retropepsin-like domain-containing protein [Clostridia bacterium]